MIKKLTTCLYCWIVTLMIAPISNAIVQLNWSAVDKTMLAASWAEGIPNRPYPSYDINDFFWGLKVVGTANEYFRPRSQLPLDRLIDRGIFKIDSINLKQLRKKIGKVDWDVLGYGMLSGSGDKNFAAIHFIQNKRVIINGQIFEQFTDQYNESFLLHEALGAIGINDEHYQLSSLIGALGMEDDMDALKRKISEIEKSGSLKTDRRWLEVRYQLEEGGIIIGGGGDIETINFKTRCLSLYDEWFTSRYINQRHINKLGEEEERTNGFSNLLNLKIEKITPGIPALQSLSSPEEDQILYRKSDNTLLISNYLLYNHTEDNEKIWFFLDNISDKFLFKSHASGVSRNNSEETSHRALVAHPKVAHPKVAHPKVDHRADQHLSDLFFFYVHGDAENLDYTACKTGESSCSSSDRVKKQFNESVMTKIKNLAETCKKCDILVVHTKPEWIRKKSNHLDRGAQQRDTYSAQRLYFYRDGHLEDEKSFTSVNDSLYIPFVPGLSFVMSFAKKDDLSSEIDYFLDRNLHKKYRYQLAFFFGHKIPEQVTILTENMSRRTRIPEVKGYHKSASSVQFSYDYVLNALNNLSRGINGKDRPFDALFLAQCLSTIETIYKVHQQKAASLVVASPELGLLKAFANWDLNSIYERIAQSEESLKHVLSDWMEANFTLGTPESITDKIFNFYSLSLYDMDLLNDQSEEFEKGVGTLLKTKRAIQSDGDDGKSNWLEIASGQKRDEKMSLFSQLPTFDCNKIEGMENFVETFSSAVLNYSSDYSLADIIGNKPPKRVSHSGWSCL